MNLMAVSRAAKQTPYNTTVRRASWPEHRTLSYDTRLRSFTVKDGGSQYLFTTDDLFAQDWSITHDQV